MAIQDTHTAGLIKCIVWSSSVSYGRYLPNLSQNVLSFVSTFFSVCVLHCIQHNEVLILIWSFNSVIIQVIIKVSEEFVFIILCLSIKFLLQRLGGSRYRLTAWKKGKTWSKGWKIRGAVCFLFYFKRLLNRMGILNTFTIELVTCKHLFVSKM